MKIIVFTQGGIYDYEFGVIKKYAPKIYVAEFRNSSEMFFSRIDHADLIIYFDRSLSYYYENIEFDIEMIVHGKQSSPKNIRALLITQSNPSVQSNLPRTRKVWEISTKSITEVGVIEEVPYRNCTYEKTEEYDLNTTFVHLAWDKFEERFVK